MMNSRDAAYVVIGGGLVGTALGYGLARLGHSVILLDEGDRALRASRGNFGLVWVQGKGLHKPEYAALSRRSADLWPGFAAELKEVTGIDVGHERRGGAMIASSEAELEGFVTMLAQIRSEAGDTPYDYEVLDHRGLEKLVPGLGPQIPGGTFSPYDGHVDPLCTLRALHDGFSVRHGKYVPNCAVTAIHPGESGFRLETAKGPVMADRVVIAAGLASADLAPMVGLNAPVRPVHGQLLITERAPRRLEIPTNIIRQVQNGGFQIGLSHEDLGFTTETRAALMRDIACNAVRALPYLGDLRVLRTWGALRIMTPDGFPIYAESARHPGVYVMTCHSGVTLAAAHALEAATWIAAGGLPDEARPFSGERFDVQAA